MQEFLGKMTCAVQEVGLGDDNGTFWSNWCPLGAWGVISVNPTLCLSSVFNSVLAYTESVHIAVAGKMIQMQHSNPLRAVCSWDGSNPLSNTKRVRSAWEGGRISLAAHCQRRSHVIILPLPWYLAVGSCPLQGPAMLVKEVTVLSQRLSTLPCSASYSASGNTGQISSAGLNGWSGPACPVLSSGAGKLCHGERQWPSQAGSSFQWEGDASCRLAECQAPYIK